MTTPRHKHLVQRLLAAKRLEQMMDENTKIFGDCMLQTISTLTPPGELWTQLETVLQQQLVTLKQAELEGWEEGILARTTEEELQASLDFYESALGQKNLQIMLEIVEELKPWSAKRRIDVVSLMADLHKKAEQAELAATPVAPQPCPEQPAEKVETVEPAAKANKLALIKRVIALKGSVNQHEKAVVLPSLTAAKANITSYVCTLLREVSTAFQQFRAGSRVEAERFFTKQLDKLTSGELEALIAFMESQPGKAWVELSHEINHAYQELATNQVDDFNHLIHAAVETASDPVNDD